MPIFEYVCKDCQKKFEALVYGAQKAKCPQCSSSELDQLISTFSVGSASRSSAPSLGGCAAAGAGGG